MNKILSILLLISHAAQGAIYYVDFVAGSDSNAGTSTNTGQFWKRHPWDVSATGVSAATVLGPGDEVRFKCGVTNIARYFIKASGTPGNPIKSYGWTNWGTGTKAHFTLTNTPNVSCWQIPASGVNGVARSNVWFENMSIRDYGGWPDSDPVFSGASNTISVALGASRAGNAFYFDQMIRDSTFKNLDLFELGHHRNVPQNTSGDCLAGVGIRFDDGAINNWIENVTTYGSQFGIYFLARAGLPVVGNIITNSNLGLQHRWCLSFTMGAQHAIIRSNQVVATWIHDFQDYDQQHWQGDPTGEDFDSPHTNGSAQFNNPHFNTDWGVGDGVIFNRCRFTYDNSIDSRSGGGTSMLFASRNASFAVYNSLFLNIKQPYYLTIPHSNTPSVYLPQHIRFINNTVYSASPSIIRINPGGSTFTETNRFVDVRGNLFIAGGTANIRVMNLEGETGNALNQLTNMNGNAYWHTGLSQGSWTRLGTILGSLKTFAQMQAFGYELDGVYGDPMLTNAFAAPWHEADPTPLPGSPLINAGLNLTNINPIDYFGNSRVGRPITIGAALPALEDDPDPGDTDPPTPDPMTWVNEPFVSSVSQFSTTISMTWTTATDDSGGAITYTVTEHTGNPGCSGTESTTSTTFVDDDIPFETTCTYSVVARDTTGNTTDPSTQESVQTPVAPPPIAYVANLVTFSNLFVTPPSSPLLYHHDWEETGAPDGVTIVGDADPDDTFAPYSQVQALIAPNTANASYAWRDFSATTNFTHVFAVRRTTIGTTPRVVSWWGDSTVTNKGGVALASTGATFWEGGVTNTISFTATVGVYYLFEVAAQTGDGDDGRTRVTVHTNLNFGESTWTNNISTGTSTGDYSRIHWGNILSSAIGDIRWDLCTGYKGYLDVGELQP